MSPMKALLTAYCLLLTGASGAWCVGADPCLACKDCSRCKYCNNGTGSCGVLRNLTPEQSRQRLHKKEKGEGRK